MNQPWPMTRDCPAGVLVGNPARNSLGWTNSRGGRRGCYDRLSTNRDSTAPCEAAHNEMANSRQRDIAIGLSDCRRKYAGIVAAEDLADIGRRKIASKKFLGQQSQGAIIVENGRTGEARRSVPRPTWSTPTTSTIRANRRGSERSTPAAKCR